MPQDEAAVPYHGVRKNHRVLPMNNVDRSKCHSG